MSKLFRKTFCLRKYKSTTNRSFIHPVISHEMMTRRGWNEKTVFTMTETPYGWRVSVREPN